MVNIEKYTEEKFYVKFPYDKDIVKIMKRNRGKFNWDKKIWIFDNIKLKELIEDLKSEEIDFCLDESIDTSSPLFLRVVEEKEGVYILKFPYNEEMKDFVKENFSSRTFVRGEGWKVYIKTEKDIEVFFEFLNRCKEIGRVEVPKNVIEYLNNKKETIKKNIEASFKASSSFKIPAPEGLNYYPFQRAGIEFCERIARGRCLFGDEMGLGKTIQALGWLNLHPEVRPVLVISPNTVKYNWEREIKKWIIEGNSTQVITKGKDNIEDKDFVVINYDLISKKENELINKEFKCVIIDEAHYIKNGKAKRTKTVLNIAKDIKFILALTGTPVLNRPVEAFNILNLLSPSQFPSWKQYVYRYCNAHYTYIRGVGDVLDVSGASNTEELGELLRSSVMIRRRKDQVLKELPDKIRTIIEVNNINKNIKKLEKEIKTLIKEINILKKNKKKEGISEEEKKELEEKIRSSSSYLLEVIEEYRQEAGRMKLPYLYEMIDSLIEQDNKVIVFAYHREFVEELKNHYKDISVSIIGGDSAEKRQEAIDKFQNNKDIKLFIGSIRASSEGITLTASSNVIFLEYDWTPARMIQAEDRAHRVGQKDTVNSFWLALKDSIDYFFIEKIINKIKIIESITEARKIEENMNVFDLIETLNKEV